jgi:Domain of unknown function (DUF4157)
MGNQRLIQTQTAATDQKQHLNKPTKQSEHPIQEVLGSRAASRQFRAQLQRSQAEGASSPNPLRSILPSISPVSPRAIQAKPMFRGLSHELTAAINSDGMVIQAKMTIGAPVDKYEQEADRVAEQIVQKIHAPSSQESSLGGPIQHQKREEDGNALMMKPLAQRQPVGGMSATQYLESSINRARGGGQPLEAGLQQKMGQAMGVDFSGVKVHTDNQADQLNRSIQAKAFTTGQDIFFRQGAYQPRSRGEQELIAHELTHVVQQNLSVAKGNTTDADNLQRNQMVGNQSAGQHFLETAPGSIIQCMFPAAPHAGDLDEINRVDNRAAGTVHKDQGVTSQPQNYVAPNFNIHVKRGKKGYTAAVEQTRSAYIGDCEATYLGSGAYDSGFRWGTDPLYDGGAVSNRLLTPLYAGVNDTEHVIFNVSANVARGSKAAEQEHLNDYRYAYDLTLGAAEEAIKAVETRTFSGTTKTAAKASAKAALLEELSVGSNRNLNSLNKTDWQNKYRELFWRSGTERDGPGYHIQTLVENTYWSRGLAKKLSRKLRGYPVHHVDVAPGPGTNFRLGVPSKDVVDPNA